MHRKVAPLENGGETVWKRVFVESVQLAASMNRRINGRRLQNIRIESCWLVNATNDGPQKRISSLPLFQSSLNHRPFLRPALFRTRDVLSKFGKIVEAKFPDPIPDRSAKMTKRLKNCELRKNFETNIASQFQFYFSRMESGVYSRET